MSVYQEPSLIPDLDIRSNLRLTETPFEPFRHWVQELGLERIDLSAAARNVPLASLRIIDLARALAIQPDVLMLDEMTAALPANLTERVLEVVSRQREGGRSVIYISHRMSEIASICDRATVLREGATVGVVDVTEGSEDRIVELMLGEIAEVAASAVDPSRRVRQPDAQPRLSVRGISSGVSLSDVSFDLYPGEVLGLVALEGQGQDELFDILSGSERPSAGSLILDGKPVSFGHPADAIRAGLVYVAADRAEALLMQRSVRENIALPFTSRVSRWGPINLRAERKRVDGAIETLQIDVRAQREVRRLSGGNQQKVTIARWVAGGVRTMVCFDPTRGIDIRTKAQIYALLRDLVEAGAAILLYTSDLNEIQLACDRCIVVFGGRIVAELDAAEADEPALLRAVHNLRPDAPLPEEVAAAAIAAESVEAPAASVSETRRVVTAASPTFDEATRRPGEVVAAWARGNAWALGLFAFLVVLLVFTRTIQPNYGVTGIQGLAISVLPLAFAAVAQAIVVISGGIDLSIGSMMALTSIVAAMSMRGQSEEFAVAVVIGVLLLGMVLGAINGTVIVLTRVPDIVVTLAMLFVWAGAALLVSARPGGEAADWLRQLVLGLCRQRMDPQGSRAPARAGGCCLDPHPPLQAWPGAVRDRQQPGRSVPQRRVGGPDQGGRLHAGGTVRGDRRAQSGREHRRRHAGPGAVHVAERGGSGSGWGQPGRRARRSAGAHPGRADPGAPAHGHDVSALGSQLREVAQGILLVGVVMVGSLIQWRRSRR